MHCDEMAHSVEALMQHRKLHLAGPYGLIAAAADGTCAQAGMDTDLGTIGQTRRIDA
jgi:hypothetical protein